MTTTPDDEEDGPGSNELMVMRLAASRPPARPPHDASWFRAGVFAVSEHLHAVDEDVHHPGRVLVRLVERRVVRDRGRIEHRDVREEPGFEQAATIELQILGRKSGQPPDRLRRAISAFSSRT